jgi:hypothetical protein
MDAIGSVFLDGVQFTTDPKVYEPTFPKRVSVHAGLGGAVTVQDFGRYAKDGTLRLQSSGQWLDQATVDAIDARADVKGATYPFKDWVGTEATVFITSFRAIPTYLPDLYEYELELRVLGLTKRRGTAYGGT